MPFPWGIFDDSIIALYFKILGLAIIASIFAHFDASVWISNSLVEILLVLADGRRLSPFNTPFNATLNAPFSATINAPFNDPRHNESLLRTLADMRYGI